MLTFADALKLAAGVSVGIFGLGWLVENIPSGALYHNSKRKDAEDYNSFTQDMEDLIDKYGKLEHYETQYYDNRMDVSFAFRPHDPYFDDVELDSENWGGDPDGPLAQALAKARAAVRKPLKITKLPHPNQKSLKDFEADEWKLLPRDALGRWQKPVDSESIYQLRETLSSDVPDISDLLTMYGGDTPSNRFRLYRDLQQLSLDQMDAALPDDSQVSFDEADMTWMTPEEYFQYILEEEINVPEGENEESSLEFQDRLVRYTAATMSPTEIQELIADNMEEITKDLFVDREEAEGEIQYLKAVLRYQNFASKWQAEDGSDREKKVWLVFARAEPEDGEHPVEEVFTQRVYENKTEAQRYFNELQKLYGDGRKLLKPEDDWNYGGSGEAYGTGYWDDDGYFIQIGIRELSFGWNQGAFYSAEDRAEAEANQFKCDLCGIILSGSNRHVAGVGHYIDNYNSKGGYCCDQCNFTVVLPARTRGEHL